MRRPPIDTSGLEIVGLACSPKIKDRQTGEIATDASGVPKHAVDAYIRDPRTDDAGMVRITVATSDPPAIAPGQPLRVSGLRVMHWETGGRAGMAWSADEVAVVSVPSRQREAS
ncbi:hypothetical protein [Blastococcus sp. Marseille-P5729]|uniref:hypothetical protein n=1 Tax=Blastococcus sp. Marseille-P5729 TaxID=2086582 RepID=UPI00131C1D7E|nr:hypothetical protein [Blastococcus sp. Marseille-P5729]